MLPVAPLARLVFSTALLLFLAAPAQADFPGGIGGPLLDPEAPGPFDVGHMTLSETDESRGRTFQVEVWYPVDPEDAAGAPVAAYDLLFADLPSEFAVSGVAPSDFGPFSLIAFSHGNNGIRFQSFFLAEQLASHGFVVAAPDHVGNTAVDVLIPGPPFTTTDRPLDISYTITRMLERSADPADLLFGAIDPARIGVAGHSFGGFTALAMAAGFAEVPPDPRVIAIAPISPVSTSFTEAELASIDLPTLILGGTEDITTPVVPQSSRAFEFISGRPLYRVDVEGAGHNSFTDICDLVDALADVGLPQNILDFLFSNADEGCSPDLVPLDFAHQVSNRYLVSFFKAEVAGDPRYGDYLVPGGPPKKHKGALLWVAADCGDAGLAAFAFVAFLAFRTGRLRKR